MVAGVNRAGRMKNRVLPSIVNKAKRQCSRDNVQEAELYLCRRRQWERKSNLPPQGP